MADRAIKIIPQINPSLQRLKKEWRWTRLISADKNGAAFLR